MELPAFLGRARQLPCPCSWMYATNLRSSSGVHGPFLRSTFSFEDSSPLGGALPMANVLRDPTHHSVQNEFILSSTKRRKHPHVLVSLPSCNVTNGARSVACAAEELLVDLGENATQILHLLRTTPPHAALTVNYSVHLKFLGDVQT